MDNHYSNNDYRTKDLGEAAALICRSARLTRLDNGQGFYWFVFSKKELCQRIANDYWFGNLTVNAKSYQEALRTLKDRLFARR
jgi:hypothetical protein